MSLLAALGARRTREWLLQLVGLNFSFQFLSSCKFRSGLWDFEESGHKKALDGLFAKGLPLKSRQSSELQHSNPESRSTCRADSIASKAVDRVIPKTSEHELRIEMGHAGFTGSPARPSINKEVGAHREAPAEAISNLATSKLLWFEELRFETAFEQIACQQPTPGTEAWHPLSPTGPQQRRFSIEIVPGPRKVRNIVAREQKTEPRWQLSY